MFLLCLGGWMVFGLGIGVVVGKVLAVGLQALH